MGFHTLYYTLKIKQNKDFASFRGGVFLVFFSVYTIFGLLGLVLLILHVFRSLRSFHCNWYDSSDINYGLFSHVNRFYLFVLQELFNFISCFVIWYCSCECQFVL